MRNKLMILAIIAGISLPFSVDAACPRGTRSIVRPSDPALEIPDSPFSNFCIPDGSDITVILQYVFNTLLGFAGALAVLFLILGGIRYIVSAGNEDQIRSARSTIVNAIIGIVVILLIFVILNTVFRVINP